jgi:hypothetical protein
MSMVVPDAVEGIVLNQLLASALTLRLFGNNKTPSHSDTTAAYTEIAGGGYVTKPLTFANWVITLGEPSTAVYNATQNWLFTGVINAPGSIYGYYVTRDSDNQLMWAERFPSANVPFVPIEGSTVALLPKFSAQSLF